MVCNESHWYIKISPQIWTKDYKDAWKFVIGTIVSDTALVYWDHHKRIYIQTDFYAKGMEFVGMQLASNAILMAAMFRKTKGGPCKFTKDPLKDDSTRPIHQIQSVCFGSWRCKGYKGRLHSYL